MLYKLRINGIHWKGLGMGRKSKNDPFYAEMHDLIRKGMNRRQAAKTTAAKHDAAETSLYAGYPNWVEKNDLEMSEGSGAKKLELPKSTMADDDVISLLKGRKARLEAHKKEAQRMLEDADIELSRIDIALGALTGKPVGNAPEDVEIITEPPAPK